MMNVKIKRRKEHYEPIYFAKKNFGDINKQHDDPMVISTLIHNFLIKRVLINQGIQVAILYSHAVEVLGLQKIMYKFVQQYVRWFCRGQVHVEGIMTLQMILGSQPCEKNYRGLFLDHVHP